MLGWAWMNGGRVPNDHTKLAYITRCSVRRWRKIAPTVRAFFTLADGFLTQSRLTEELQKAVTRSNRAKVAANEGWSKRKSLKDNEAGHATASPQHMAEHVIARTVESERLSDFALHGVDPLLSVTAQSACEP